jgi:hypothetical protein
VPENTGGQATRGYAKQVEATWQVSVWKEIAHPQKLRSAAPKKLQCRLQTIQRFLAGSETAVEAERRGSPIDELPRMNEEYDGIS